MEIKTLSLTNGKQTTQASLTAYLQTPTPKAPVSYTHLTLPTIA